MAETFREDLGKHFFKYVFIFERDRDRDSVSRGGGGAERERETQNLMQASGSVLSRQSSTRLELSRTVRS